MCASNEKYIGENRRRALIKWSEYEDSKKKLESAKNFSNHPGYSFYWKLLLPALANNHVRKIMEASMIALNRAILNKQVETQRSLLFRNGAT